MNKIRFQVMAATLSTFSGIVYLLCVVFRPIFPGWAMYTSPMWSAAFPGFSWTLGGVFLGLVESLLYGLLTAAVFVPIYIFFENRFGQAVS